MFLFITAIGILAATAALCALLAVRPPSKATGRAANAVGVIGAFAGCFVGLCALASGPWAGQESLRLPLALPVGSCALGMTGGTVWFELALLLDVFVAVFVMGIAINHISDSFASIDVARFRSLRD